MIQKHHKLQGVPETWVKNTLYTSFIRRMNYAKNEGKQISTQNAQVPGT